jgi:hypothetical protein
MKVHPEMLMKTKERGKFACGLPGKMPGASKSEACDGQERDDSDFWLLTPHFCFKNEGASGDIDENKGTGKSTRGECRERNWGAPSSDPRPIGDRSL